MSSGLDRAKSIYEIKYHEVHSAETALINSTRDAVFALATALTNALELPTWKLGAASDDPEKRRVSVGDKGCVLIDKEGVIDVVVCWLIAFTFAGTPVSIDVEWGFLLKAANGTHHIGSPSLQRLTPTKLPMWDLQDERALRKQVDEINSYITELVNERATAHAKSVFVPNHAQPQQ